jgi:hypothetical protein
VEAENAMELAFAHEDAEGLVCNVTLLEDEHGEKNSCSWSDAMADTE